MVDQFFLGSADRKCLRRWNRNRRKDPFPADFSRRPTSNGWKNHLEDWRTVQRRLRVNGFKCHTAETSPWGIIFHPSLYRLHTNKSCKVRTYVQSNLNIRFLYTSSSLVLGFMRNVHNWRNQFQQCGPFLLLASSVSTIPAWERVSTASRIVNSSEQGYQEQRRR